MRLVILTVLITSTVVAHSLPLRLLAGPSPSPARPLPSPRLRRPRPLEGSASVGDTDGTVKSSPSPPPIPRRPSPRRRPAPAQPQGTRSHRGRPKMQKKKGLRRGINIGKKIGLLFIGMAAVLQVAVVGFLGFKRWQISNMKSSAADSTA